MSNNGCNYFNGASTRSTPFAIFNKSDVLQLAIELKVPIPEAYGVIGFDRNGTLYTTKTARTGCEICAFGIQFEKTRPNRFDKLHDADLKNGVFGCMIWDMVNYLTVSDTNGDSRINTAKKHGTEVKPHERSKRTSQQNTGN